MWQEMKSVIAGDGGAKVYLAGLMVYADIDVSGLVDYALKAAIGGAVWMLFKLSADYVQARIIKQEEKDKAAAPKTKKIKNKYSTCLLLKRPHSKRQSNDGNMKRTKRK